MGDAVMGKDFGPYTLVQRLGVGGMAETFEAIRHGRSGFSQRVCLKLVRPALRDNVDSIELFEREARLAAKLHHSNIVSVIDFGEIEGTLYMALELVEGADLQVLLDQRNRLCPEHVALIGHDLAAALEHAHNPSAEHGEGQLDANGVIHRDISPSNVLVGRHGEVKLTDFGLANVAASGSRQSDVRGKFPYMAPERLRADPLDGRADLFSLGVVLFEALAGRRPYDGGHDPATIMLIMAGEHPPLSELAPGTPAELCRIVESLIEPEREKRPDSASALLVQLDAFVPPPDARRKLGKMAMDARSHRATNKPISGGATTGSQPSGGPAFSAATERTSSSDRKSRRTLIRLAASLALAIGVGAATFVLWPQEPESGGLIMPEDQATQQADVRETDVGMNTASGSGIAAPADDTNARDMTGTAETTKERQPIVPAPAPTPARLTVLVSPWGSVWINGKPRGAAPLKNEGLKPGRYKISAGRDGPSQTRTVVLREGDRKTIRFDL
ncbi:MAG: serine/threonine-protein kinase [Polyangiales bacterium]